MKWWRLRAAQVAEDMATFGDGVALGFGLANRTAPATITGAIAVALHMTARFLQGRGRS